MALTSVARRLTPGEVAREPRMMHITAWYDGWGQAQGMPPRDHPRRLTPAEAQAWRDGYAQGRCAVAAGRGCTLDP